MLKIIGVHAVYILIATVPIKTEVDSFIKRIASLTLTLTPEKLMIFNLYAR
ncbi:hypothetical protein KB20921_11930 [Edwardsiella ictaluri]|nr:hypothetical protein KH20906_11610 [Edwardsiella ictaluri]BEI01932.1 hypothetical protein KB20921_11930 [Edwardsiella ictaluri]BEI05400.1 hypothetical protein KH201010_11860 [Edwardsiella ictaluri]BEI08859.1 hypothetical protein STU22726_11900 [Edwardsiella ictaluri]BEI12338.1 hypothetical protein STU22816_11910 [Edwardsiella ictaluri]